MRENVGFGESVAVEVIRASPSWVQWLREYWMWIALVVFIIVFLWLIPRRTR